MRSENIHKDLLNLISIQKESREIGLELLDNPDILERRLFFDEADRPLDQGMDIPLLFIRLPLTGEIEKSLDDIPAPRSLLYNRFEVFSPGMGFIDLLEKERTEREDSGEGIIDLMGHSCSQFSRAAIFPAWMS